MSRSVQVELQTAGGGGGAVSEGAEGVGEDESVDYRSLSNELQQQVGLLSLCGWAFRWGRSVASCESIGQSDGTRAAIATAVSRRL